VKVYVVLWDSQYDGSDFEAVYASKEKAEAHAKRLDEAGRGSSGGKVVEADVIE